MEHQIFLSFRSRKYRLWAHISIRMFIFILTKFLIRLLYLNLFLSSRSEVQRKIIKPIEGFANLLHCLDGVNIHSWMRSYFIYHTKCTISCNPSVSQSWHMRHKFYYATNTLWWHQFSNTQDIVEFSLDLIWSKFLFVIVGGRIDFQGYIYYTLERDLEKNTTKRAGEESLPTNLWKLENRKKAKF